MKVGISCNRFGAGGGLERYALDISRAMAGRAGTEVSVYARRFDAGVAESAGIVPHRIVVSWLPGKLRDRYFSWRLQARRPADEVLIGCNRVRGSDIAICGGTHRGYLGARGTTARRSDQWQIDLESAQYAGAHRVVAHSALMRREVIELYGMPPDRVELIYPPVDTQRFTPVDADARAALRREFGFGDDEVVFLFPSSGHARKGFDLLADYFSKSDLPITLAVAGRPVGRTIPRVRELGYSSRIDALYRAADFTILASGYEPFGLVGVESVLCGTPLVFADNIACLEVIRPQAVHAFARDRAETLERAIHAAVDAARSGQGRLANPMAMLNYDPGIEAHVDALLALAASARAARQAA
ncbi:glycosyl transferase family 1 [Cupriavidus necator]|uniref:glycosyltransferase family 4 protein n=1 Tax=Cupriavidus TaxID=106589 RepID=UPI0003302B88|nr:MULTISPECIES: glycosyltransferase family 4 protein [Cupriavidus]EON17786.1 glycosyltransferase [Cupriavidus sp. GA3-3]KUE89500.1 glycosyl transferase family 1 [Cupriavidus necator]